MKIDSDEVTSSDRGTLEFTSEESVHPRLEFIRFSVAVRLRKEDLVLKCNTYATGLVSLVSVLTLSNKCVAISMYIRFNIIMLNRENGRSWKSFFFFFFANFIRIIIVGSCNWIAVEFWPYSFFFIKREKRERKEEEKYYNTFNARVASFFFKKKIQKRYLEFSFCKKHARILPLVRTVFVSFEFCCILCRSIIFYAVSQVLKSIFKDPLRSLTNALIKIRSTI